jgi:hypothetical protein
MSDTVSAKSIKAQMPHVTLTRILGEPSHRQLKQLERKLTANLMVVPCPWGHNKGHLGLLQDPVLYVQRNGAAFTIPAAALPAYPVIVAGITTAKREEQRANNISACKAWSTYMIVHTTTRDQFAASIDDIYYAALNDATEGLNAVTLRQLVTHIRTTYVQISQPDLDDNVTNFNQGIDLNLPLAVYTQKQEKCGTFAQDAGVPISEEMMVTNGTKHALNCGNMMLAWREWKHRPLLDHMWKNWKDHWMTTFAEMRDINCMTSGNLAFANQAAAREIVQAEKMAALLDNLANASIQKNNMIDKKLVAMNQQQVKIIASLTEAIVKLKAGSPSTEQQLGRTTPLHWRSTKPAWDPTWYCWMHGFWVKVGHSSTTCSFPREGHCKDAIHANMKGGSNRG